MTRLCPHCSQPLPEPERRDPPLPALEHPNVVTIHDLPAAARAKARVVQESMFHARRLAEEPRDGC